MQCASWHQPTAAVHDTRMLRSIRWSQPTSVPDSCRSRRRSARKGVFRALLCQAMVACICSCNPASALRIFFSSDCSHRVDWVVPDPAGGH